MGKFHNKKPPSWQLFYVLLSTETYSVEMFASNGFKRWLNLRSCSESDPVIIGLGSRFELIGEGFPNNPKTQLELEHVTL